MSHGVQQIGVNSMEYKKLSRANISLSRIGLGTAQFGLDYGFSKVKTPGQVAEILDCCRENGINFIDTAPAYGDSEKKIGAYLKKTKNSFIIATKIAKILQETVQSKKNLQAFIKESIGNSQKRLGIDRLDLLLLHQTEDYITENEGFWDIISELKRDGSIRLFGLSVYDVEPTRDLIRQYEALIDFVQAPYNVFDQRFNGLFDDLQERKIDVISRSTFLKGVISCHPQNIPAELDGIRGYRAQLAKAAERFQLKDIEFSLLKVVKNQNIHSTIIGVSSKDELQQDINILVSKTWDPSWEDVSDALAIDNLFYIDPRRWTQL